MFNVIMLLLIVIYSISILIRNVFHTFYISIMNYITIFKYYALQFLFSLQSLILVYLNACLENLRLRDWQHLSFPLLAMIELLSRDLSKNSPLKSLTHLRFFLFFINTIIIYYKRVELFPMIFIKIEITLEEYIIKVIVFIVK